jgi:hypothetical protein
MTTAHRYLVRLTALGVLMQFFLAGAGAFGATSFTAHTALGTTLIGLTAIALLAALVARRLRRHTALLFGVTLLQGLLGTLGADTQAWFGGLHAVNALAVMGAAATLARRTAAAPTAGSLEYSIASTSERGRTLPRR